jgi:hypothetical protein
LLLNLLSIPIIDVVSIAIGVRAATERGRPFDVGSRVVMHALWSVPTMLAGVLLTGFFASEQYWHWFPAAGLSRREALDMPFLPHWGSLWDVLVLFGVISPKASSTAPWCCTLTPAAPRRAVRCSPPWRHGIVSSHSRPRVNDDNAFSEALFRTCKYRASYPVGGFADLTAARAWALKLVHWYNTEHRHSAIRFVTPHQRHTGEDRILLDQRHPLYAQGKARHPKRWSGTTRDWTPTGPVTLNARPQSDSPLAEAV